ncbi:ParD-like antitoxin of type II toxin-antitoxin system [uncultured Thiomicrorhabdus sp.]|jgi:hypothetical protein
MSISIRVNDDFYQAAKTQAQAEHRTIQNQIEYWAEIGRTAIDNPDLSIEAVKDLLIARKEVSESFEFIDE